MNIDARIAIMDAIEGADLIYMVCVNGDTSRLVVVGGENQEIDPIDEISTALINQLSHELDNDDSPPILCDFLAKVEEGENCMCEKCRKGKIESAVEMQKN